MALLPSWDPPGRQVAGTPSPAAAAGDGLEKDCHGKIRVSLEQLDAFLALSRQQPELQARLQDGVDLDTFLALAQAAGFRVDENDVISAQQRAEASLSDEELQRRAGEEARRLRHFIPG